jgi:hypothetical protein
MGPSGFAVIFGLLYLGVGMLGFIPASLAPPPADAPSLVVSGLYGYLLGVFPVNWLHSTAHLLLGTWGIAVAKSYHRSLSYVRAAAVILGVLVVFGLMPGLRTVFGVMPLYGYDLWLHGLTGALAIYIGYFRHSPVPAY